MTGTAWASASFVVVLPVDVKWMGDPAPLGAFKGGYWSLGGLTAKQSRKAIGTEQERDPTRRFFASGVAQALAARESRFSADVDDALRDHVRTELGLDLRAIEHRTFGPTAASDPERVAFVILHLTVPDENLGTVEEVSRQLRRPGRGNSFTKILTSLGYEAEVLSGGRVAHRTPGDPDDRRYEWGDFFLEPVVMSHLIPGERLPSPPVRWEGELADDGTAWAWQMASGAPGSGRWLPPVTSGGNGAPRGLRFGSVRCVALQHGLSFVAVEPLLADDGSEDESHRVVSRYVHTWAVDLFLLAWRQRRQIEALAADAPAIPFPQREAIGRKDGEQVLDELLTLSTELGALEAHLWFSSVPYRDHDTAVLQLLQSAMGSSGALETLRSRLDTSIATLTLAGQRQSLRRERIISFAVALVAVPSLVLTGTQVTAEPGWTTLSVAILLSAVLSLLVVAGLRIWPRPADQS